MIYEHGTGRNMELIVGRLMNFISDSLTSLRTKVTSVDLDVIGRQHGLDQSSLHHNYLKTFSSELERYKKFDSHIWIITAKDPVSYGSALGRYFSSSTITVFALNWQEDPDIRKNTNVDILDCRSLGDMHDKSMLLCRPDVIIEDGKNTKSQKIAIFREFFFALKDEGTYVIEDLHAAYVDSLDDVDGEDVLGLVNRILDQKRRYKVSGPRLKADERPFVAALGSCTNYGKIAFLRKSGTSLLKLRDGKTDRALTSRYGSAWGKSLYSTPAMSTKFENTLWTNTARLESRFKNPLSVPQMNVRAYSDVDCYPRKVCILGDFILPDSFRHGGARRLRNVALEDANEWFANERSVRTTRYLKGSFYYLDTQYPGHFGHVMTEVLSHLWAWKHAKKIYPNMRVLLSLPKNMEALPSFQLEIFRTMGIDSDSIEYIRQDEFVRVETLISCTPHFSNPNWAHPELQNLWKGIAGELMLNGFDSPEKIFITRPYSDERSCNNTQEVEDFFSERGFDVISPELFSFREQVTMFSNAKVIAGFGGSGMFNMMFARNPGACIIISGETYLSANEHLIAGITNSNLYYFWCPSDRQYPDHGWETQAFRSNFTFNFDRDGGKLESILRNLDSGDLA